MNNITSLHGHSLASWGDSINKLPEYAQELVNLGVDSMPITEHGSLCSVLKQQEVCKKFGLKPIYGVEFYFQQYEKRAETQKSNHITVLAKNEQGFKNLLKLNAYSCISVKDGGGSFYKPRINEKILFQYQEGLVVGAGCIYGIINQFILEGDMDKAHFWAKMMKDNIENLYMEIMPHHFEQQGKLNKEVILIANKFDIPLITTCDVHYGRENKELRHKTWLIANGLKRNKKDKEVEDEFVYPDLIAKNNEEIIESYEWQGLYPEYKKEIESSIENVNKITDSINFDIKLDIGLPKFIEDADKHLWDLAHRGMIGRFGKNYKKEKPEYHKRLVEEYDILVQHGFSDYLLIVQDIFEFCKKNNIFVGPGRGSSAGSLLLYAIGITNVDPIRFGLLFERFFNKKRVSLLDIDSDFQSSRREDIIKYLKDKYGENRVVGIVNFSELKAKSVVKDLAKWYEIPFPEMNALAKYIPFKMQDEDEDEAHDITVKDLDKIPEFIKFFKEHPEIRDKAEFMEGAYRQLGKHAAGVVILPDDFENILPVVRVKDTICSALEKTDLEKANGWKIDILGLTTLDLLANLKDLTGKDPMEIVDTGMDDPRVYEHLQKAKHLYGIFQMDSKVQEGILPAIKPTNIFELSNCTSIGRPTCLSQGDDKTYVKNRDSGNFNLPFDIPCVNDVLAPTNGIMIYQEQIMYICEAVGNLDFGWGDRYRKLFERASKDPSKYRKDLDEMNGEFIQAGLKQGHSKKDIEILADWMLKRASYGFNQSHSISYCINSYITTWFKVYYPQQFAVACLRTWTDTEDTQKVLSELFSMGYTVETPRWNNISAMTVPTPDGILLGLSSFKGFTESSSKKLEELSKRVSNAKEFLDEMVQMKYTYRSESKVQERVCFNVGHVEKLIKIGFFGEDIKKLGDAYNKKFFKKEKEYKTFSTIQDGFCEFIGFDFIFMKKTSEAINKYPGNYIIMDCQTKIAKKSGKEYVMIDLLGISGKESYFLGWNEKNKFLENKLKLSRGEVIDCDIDGKNVMNINKVDNILLMR